MTNSTNKMIGRNLERRSTGGPPRSERKVRTPKIHSVTYFSSIATPLRTRPSGGVGIGLQHSADAENRAAAMRLSSGSPSHSPRTSPGLMAGHFAGGKWSEPPSPAALPKPPQQWTEFMLASKCSGKQVDITNHLKLLLNVQA